MDPSQRAALRLVLNDLIRERDNLNITITTLSARLGDDTSEVPPSQAVGQIRMLEPVGLPDGAIVSAGELVGMSSKTAAAHVLQKAQRPLTTKEVLRLLRRGGLPLTGMHATNTLRRALHADETFYYVRPGYWGVRDDHTGSEESPSDG